MEASRSDTVQTSVEKSDGTTSENLECESEREDEEAYERKGGVPPESVMNEADALAVLATFSTSEYMLFLKKLAHNARPKERKWMLEMLAQFLTQRSPEENEDLMNAASGAAFQVPPVLAERARREARADAEAKMKAAMESIMYAQQILQACGGDGIADLQRAMELLQADTDPLAQGAAQAQQLVRQVLSNCPAASQKAVKKADRDVRDIVMFRCRAECCDPKDREDFLARAAEAYGGKELDNEEWREVRAQLLLSYHKDRKNQKCGFVSNNQIAADRRGGPRPRRRRQKAAGKTKEASAAGSDKARPEKHQDTGGASSICAAAESADQPMYIMVQENQVQSSWETPLVFYEAEEIVPGSMADNEAKDRHKSLVWKFRQKDVNGAEPEGLNPESDEKVVPVNRCGRGEAGRRPVAIGQQPSQAYQQSADYAAHHHLQGPMGLYDQYYGALYMNAQYEMMQAQEARTAMQTLNGGHLLVEKMRAREDHPEPPKTYSQTCSVSAAGQ